VEARLFLRDDKRHGLLEKVLKDHNYQECAKVCPVGTIYIEGENIEYTKDPQVITFIVERRKHLK
jgi:hypothetical protein